MYGVTVAREDRTLHFYDAVGINATNRDSFASIERLRTRSPNPTLDQLAIVHVADDTVDRENENLKANTRIAFVRNDGHIHGPKSHETEIAEYTELGAFVGTLYERPGVDSVVCMSREAGQTIEFYCLTWHDGRNKPVDQTMNPHALRQRIQQEWRMESTEPST